MSRADKTILYGDVQVPVLVRHWKRRKEMVPCYRTDLMTPGQRWSDIPTTGARYYRFMRIAQQQCRALRSGQGTNWNPLKAIDEYNYCKHTKGWII